MQGATGHVRHVASNPDLLRIGLGWQLMQMVIADARAIEIMRLECLSTRTAEAFYTAMGFRRIVPLDVTLGSGIVFLVVQMVSEVAG